MSNQYTVPSNSPYFNSSPVSSQYTDSTPATNPYKYQSNKFDNRFVQQLPTQYNSYQYANNYFAREESSEHSRSSYDQESIFLIDNACSNYTNEYKGESKEGYKTPNNSPAEMENEMTDEIYVAPLSFPIPIPQTFEQKNPPHSTSQAPKLTPAQSPLDDKMGEFSLPASTPVFSVFAASNNHANPINDLQQQMGNLNLSQE